jgi:hypothetical protein
LTVSTPLSSPSPQMTFSTGATLCIQIVPDPGSPGRMHLIVLQLYVSACDDEWNLKLYNFLQASNEVKYWCMNNFTFSMYALSLLRVLLQCSSIVGAFGVEYNGSIAGVDGPSSRVKQEAESDLHYGR